MQNNESSHRPYTLHNNSFKMDHRHKYKMKTIELLEEKIWENLSDPGFSDDIFDITAKARSLKNNW